MGRRSSTDIHPSTTKRPSRNSRDKEQRRSKSQPPPAQPQAQRRSGSSQPPLRRRWGVGDVVGAVFNLRCRNRRKGSSTAPESPWSTTDSSINRSAWGSTQASSVRSESNAQGRFRSAQELREAKKKAHARGNRWDAHKWDLKTGGGILGDSRDDRRPEVASLRHTPRQDWLRDASDSSQSGIRHNADSRPITNNSPATLRLSNLSGKPTPMSQYVMPSNPYSKRDAPPAPAPQRPARSALFSRPSGKQPMSGEQLMQLRRAAVHQSSAHSSNADLADPTFRRHRSRGRPRQLERAGVRTCDTFPQIIPPSRTYETLSRHAAPSRALPPPSNSGDGLLSSLNEMKRAVRTAARSGSPYPEGAFCA